MTHDNLTICIYLPCHNLHVGRQYILHKITLPIVQSHRGQKSHDVQMQWLDSANVYLIITGFLRVQGKATKQMHSHQSQLRSQCCVHIFLKHQLHVGLTMHLVSHVAVIANLAEVAPGMAGLTGQVVDVPYAITANMLILQLQDTSLQNRCAEQGILQAASACCYALSLHSDLFRPMGTSTGMPCDRLLVQKGHALCTQSAYVTLLLWIFHLLTRHFAFLCS